MEFIDAKQLLSPVKFDGDQWFGIDYIMNLYKGCNHGCIYCDSRSEKYYIDNFDKVRLKRNTENILHYELKKRKRGVINLGAMSDSYNPLETKHMATRTALRKIDEFGYGVSVETKSSLATRDIDLFRGISQKHSALVKFSITAADDRLSKLIEPNVCPASERFKAVELLRNNDLTAGVLIAPVLPFITDAEENISKLIELAYQHGASFVYAAPSVTMRDRQREHFYRCLDKSFPGLKSKYITIYEHRYVCEPPNIRKLEELVSAECSRYGLPYKMNDIIKLYKQPERNTQLELF